MFFVLWLLFSLEFFLSIFFGFSNFFAFCGTLWFIWYFISVFWPFPTFCKFIFAGFFFRLNRCKLPKSLFALSPLRQRCWVISQGCNPGSKPSGFCEEYNKKTCFWESFSDGIFCYQSRLLCFEPFVSERCLFVVRLIFPCHPSPIAPPGSALLTAHTPQPMLSCKIAVRTLN